MAKDMLSAKDIDRAIQVYDAIVWYMDSEEGRAPVVRELMVMAGMGCSATVQFYLDILREWGWITSKRFAARAIRLTRPTEHIVVRKKAAKKATRHVA